MKIKIAKIRGTESFGMLCSGNELDQSSDKDGIIELKEKDKSIGKKYTDMDLIGIPYQIIIGPRDLKNGKIEFKKRSEDKKELLEVKGITAKLISKIV